MTVFNATEHKPETGFEPIDNDWYDLVAVKHETRTGQESGNQYENFQIKITTGPFAGRVIFKAFHLNSENARERAMKELSAFCHVVGVLAPNTWQELLNIPFKGFVSTYEDKQGKPQTNINEWRDQFDQPPVQGQLPGGGQQNPQGAAQAQQSMNQTMQHQQVDPNQQQQQQAGGFVPNQNPNNQQQAPQQQAQVDPNQQAQQNGGWGGQQQQPQQGGAPSWGGQPNNG